MLERIGKMLLYYIIGFAIFLGALHLAQTAILAIIGLDRDQIQYMYLDNILITVIIYTVLFNVIYVSLYIYDRFTVKALNEELIKMKERVKENEEAIQGNRYNDTANDGSYNS